MIVVAAVMKTMAMTTATTGDDDDDGCGQGYGLSQGSSSVLTKICFTYIHSAHSKLSREECKEITY